MAWITLVIAPILILLMLGEDGRPCASAQHMMNTSKRSFAMLPARRLPRRNSLFPFSSLLR
jgi:hypothetical protein